MSVKVRVKSDKQEDENELLLAVEKGFRCLGIAELKRPVDGKGNPLNPSLPFDLTTLDDVQLARLYSEFCAMAQYVKLHLARMAVATADSKRQEKMLRARVRLEKSGQVGDKDAKVEVDPKTVEASFATHVAAGTHMLAEAVMEGYLIGRDACSREQTRRQSVYDRERR